MGLLGLTFIMFLCVFNKIRLAIAIIKVILLILTKDCYNLYERCTYFNVSTPFHYRCCWRLVGILDSRSPNYLFYWNSLLKHYPFKSFPNSHAE